VQRLITTLLDGDPADQGLTDGIRLRGD